MENYETAEASQAAAWARARGLADEDGFVTVQSRSKKKRLEVWPLLKLSTLEASGELGWASLDANCRVPVEGRERGQRKRS